MGPLQDLAGAKTVAETELAAARGAAEGKSSQAVDLDVKRLGKEVRVPICIYKCKYKYEYKYVNMHI